MSISSRLPKLCRWIFAILTGFSVLGAVVVAAVIVINPTFTRNVSLETAVEMTPPQGTMVLTADDGKTTLSITQFRATLTGKGVASGIVPLVKRYALPLALMYVVFFAALFDLLRRLFRNVERGESFTPQTIRLVRIIGFSLLAFSLLSAAAEGWLAAALLDYFRLHPAVAAAGTKLSLTLSSSDSYAIPFDSPVFFAGLLVLALAEVFRQGLALKNENDLTV